jgi:hypothetical protein
MTSAAAAVPPPAAAPLLAADARFLPIELDTRAQATGVEPAPQTDTTRLFKEPIQIELRRGALHLIVRWPTSATGDCTAWLRELATGLLK